MEQKFTTDEAINLLFFLSKKMRFIDWQKDSYIRYDDDSKTLVDQHNNFYLKSVSDLKTYFDLHTDFWVIVPDNIKDTKEEVGICCKCNSPDEWNSKGKDGKWYCYKHCSY